ncbi:MAG: hypothetical protein Q7T48_20035 [Cellvibrio sp.]|uniref:hypothetical protein n=1 Tax=Cellvibrio sp. TaxID=1965322 RepID=UPI0027275484|nr:hypothetical protein [Cellvibrio sp.]
MKIIAETSKVGAKGWDTDLPLFADVVANPRQWLGSATEHLFAAQIMLPHINNRLKLIEDIMIKQEYISLNPCLISSYLLHCALAMENSMKALIAFIYADQIKAEIESKSKTPKILLGHDLIDLAKRIDLPLGIDQEFTLKFLTRRGVWAGKYHQPIKHGDDSPTEQLSDGNYYMTGGYNPKAIPSYFEFCLNFFHEATSKIDSSNQQDFSTT